VAMSPALPQLPGPHSWHGWHNARRQLSNSITILSQEGAALVLVKKIYFEQEEYQAEDLLAATRWMVEPVVIDIHCLAPGASA
jgi:hypothetical protein